MKRHPRIITAEWLKAQEACGPSVRAFKKIFPDGMRMTIKNLTEYHRRRPIAAPLDFLWLALELFSSREYDQFICHNGDAFESFMYVYFGKDVKR